MRTNDPISQWCRKVVPLKKTSHGIEGGHGSSERSDDEVRTIRGDFATISLQDTYVTGLTRDDLVRPQSGWCGEQLVLGSHIVQSQGDKERNALEMHHVSTSKSFQ